ncbi:hypothetical protein EV363DRAFT_1440672 [Boletus edulis]|nr:hypothetical protein EV363DRAFT_1440672 [Boletus edulis]
MSSDIQYTLQLLVLNNYLALAGVTAVVYDYALTFSREVEYIWCRPWSWVSTMFVLVRYTGLYWIVTSALYGSPFVPGPLEICKLVYLSYVWGYVVFLSTADLLMILRVYAMWNRSRTILYILLLIFMIQTIITVVVDGNYEDSNITVTIIHVLDFSFCNAFYSNASVLSPVYYITPRLVLGALLAILAVFQTLKQSFEIYKATKLWQPNRYMKKLVKDGILYFIVNVLYQTVNILNFTGFPLINTLVFLEVFVAVVFYTVIPRFVISIRELYDRDIHRGFHIDTGFGVQSRSNPGADATVSAIVFEYGNRRAEVTGGTDNSGDLELGRVHGSRLNEDSPVGDTE